MSESTTLTLAEIEEAIKRVLLNGEEWEMDDIRSKLSLKELRAMREEIISGQNGISFSGVSFGTVSGAS